MENILIGIFCLHLFHNFLQVSAFPKTATESFIIHYLEDRRIIPVKIELNANAQTEHVTSIAGETLYDFNLGKVAYKDLNSSQCFITDIVEESIEKDRRKLKNLQNGVVRGFYLPTFIIHKELNNAYNFAENFGILLAQFCVENTISLVVKQTHRRKRDAPEDKGQFSHHSYGHYGHQSNNYAHYGHETHVTGSVDESGRIRNQQVNHQQVRSKGSHVYSRPTYGNGRQDSSRLDAGFNPKPAYTNGRQDSTTDSRTNAGIPQTQYQTQHRMPPYQQTFGGGAKIPGIGGTGQFSLQSSHEGGYQLNLPLGLQAGNIYRGGVRSGGHYGGGLQPHIRSDHQNYPDSSLHAGYQPFDQRQLLPPVARHSYPSTQLGVPAVDMRKTESSIQPDTSVPAVPIDGDRHVSPSSGIQTPDTQASLTTSERRQAGTDYESQLRRQMEHKATIPGAQISPSREDRPTLTHTSAYAPAASSISDMGLNGRQPGSVPLIHMPNGPIQSPMGVHGHQPGIGLPSIHMPSQTIQSPRDVHGRQQGIGLPSIHVPSGTIQSPMQVPGQISQFPNSGISERQHVTSVSRPSQIHATYPGLIPRQQYIPDSIPEHQYLQTPNVRQPTRFQVNGDVQRRPVPPLGTSGTYPSYPSKQQETRTSFPGYQSIPGISHTSLPVSHETIRNGARYPHSARPQTTVRDEYPRSGTYPDTSRVSIDSPSTSFGRMHPVEAPLIPTRSGPIPQDSIRGHIPIRAPKPGDIVQDSRYNLSIPSRVIVSETSMPTDRGIIGGQTGFETSRISGQESASSQTQVQTGLEGTAAEASAAGHYGGLGSQAQVQGGYAGNGSFSAQAQSGFTGGVVQSQVQGGKQGGLSESSAQVERVGSAQSQVQVLKPSGSASSTAQGRFTGGTTQVQAQSSKTGGGAGAQAQSTGLSSSHVQVNVGGNDVSKDENFQGTVSASVYGGQSSGQSQTQLQGGYSSGRTYAATAQGGFDTSLGFQAAVPPVGSLTTFSVGTLGGQQVISTTGRQETHGAFRGDQHQTSGAPISRDSTDITQQQPFISPVSQMGDSRAPYQSSQTDYSRVPYSSSNQEAPRLPSSQSTYRGAYPGYPSEVRDRSPGDFSGYRGHDERGVVISDYPQSRDSGISEQQTHFGRQAPETQGRVSYKPGSQRQAYPSLPAHTFTDTANQHISKTQSTYSQLPSPYYPSQPSASIDSRYIPSFPSMPQQPGLPEQPGVQSRYVPPSQFLYPSQILPQSPQILPSHIRSGEMPILTRPDGSPYIGPTHPQLPMSDLMKIQPEQPQLLFPSSQVQPGKPRPQIQPQFPDVSFPRLQIPPEQTSISQPQPQIRPEESQTSPLKPPGSTTTEKIPMSIPSEATEVKQDRTPGVSEPDKRDCCAALRDLKRRCCGGTSKQDKTSPCCRSSKDDIFDFSSEDDLDEDKEPCKVVKAICYIVYKPVGKARVCKPTATTGC